MQDLATVFAMGRCPGEIDQAFPEAEYSWCENASAELSEHALRHGQGCFVLVLQS